MLRLSTPVLLLPLISVFLVVVIGINGALHADAEEPSCKQPLAQQDSGRSCDNQRAREDLEIVKLRSASHRNSSFFAASHRSAAEWAQNSKENNNNHHHHHHLEEGTKNHHDHQQTFTLFTELVRARQDDDKLPKLTSTTNADDELLLEAARTFFFWHKSVQSLFSVSDYGLIALVARAQAMTYGDPYLHLYDSHRDMKTAAGPQVNQEKCLRQLENLVARSRAQEREKYYSRDINFYQLMDTWGHVSSGILLGNVYFIGMYQECLRMRIITPSDHGQQQEQETSTETRFCTLTVKLVDWPKLERNDIMALKAGICIPKSCDSSSYKNKNDLLMRLVDYQLRRTEIGQTRFGRLYCLPDEDSPSRSLWNQRSSAITFVCLCLWLTLLAFATFKHSRRAPVASDATSCSLSAESGKGRGKQQGFGLTNMHCERERANSSAKSDCEPTTTTTGGAAAAQAINYAKIYQTLSVAHNLRLLFDTSKGSSLMETGEKLKASQNQPSSPAGTQTADPQQQQQQQAEIRAKANHVDLRSIEGIKVVAMTYVIMGHVLMCLPAMTLNGRELAMGNSMAYFLANLVPAFAVNAFFTITGLLTCYLILKQNQSFPFITSPAKWFAFIVYRYLRIMPLYALVVLYCKTLAKFTGSGPLWDYGTSSLSQRRTCEQEPWHYTLMFRSNFLPPLEHCIPGGWYLSNDFQFFLVTPFYLALLNKKPALGKLVIVGSIVAGYLAGFWSIWSSQVNDLRPIANFAAHGFKTYVSHLSFNYTHPQYRIPAYLIGLLMGYNLHLYEQAKREHQQAIESGQREAAAKTTGVDENGNHQTERLDPAETKAAEDASNKEPDWSDGFKKNGTFICLLLVTLCCITPVIGFRLPFTLTSARFMVSLITPSYHVLFSLAVGLYLLLATTGNGNLTLNKLLGLSLWKPLARLSLCAVLINVEVINHVVQGSTSLHNVNVQFHASINCLCVMATYAISVLVCVLFEAPIRGTLNGLLTYFITQVAAKSKSKFKGGNRSPGPTSAYGTSDETTTTTASKLKSS